MRKASGTKGPQLLPELFIGVVARMGVEVPKIVNQITGEAAKYNYQVVHYKVTDTLKLLKTGAAVTETPIEERYKSYIKACNKVRQSTNSKELFARAFITWLAATRQDHQSTGKRGIVYIIDQLKRPEEIDLLRSVYGDAFISLSCHAPLAARLRCLQNKITASHGASDNNSSWESEANSLIEMDEREENDFGQNVRKAFPKADYILNAENNLSIQEGTSRMFRLIFGDPALSPTFDEYGNNLASQAAYRSIDLSRQVGAAILNKKRITVALGCNEVPKFGGGTYWEDDTPDRRDQDLGYDINTVRKQSLVIDVVKKLQESNLVTDDLAGKTFDDLKSELLSGENGALKDAKILDITEYGRAVHAEMNAITDAARSNASTQDCTLFVTTFPCHNCAKHIVSSGILTVKYLEPYPKSQVISLYKDSIEVDPEKESRTHVKFVQFCGVTKRRFHYFSKERLKDDSGQSFEWNPKNAYCIIDKQPSDYERKETSSIAFLNSNSEYKSLLRSTSKVIK